jgi:hypothetical protein
VYLESDQKLLDVILDAKVTKGFGVEPFLTGQTGTAKLNGKFNHFEYHLMTCGNRYVP